MRPSYHHRGEYHCQHRLDPSGRLRQSVGQNGGCDHGQHVGKGQLHPVPGTVGGAETRVAVRGRVLQIGPDQMVPLVGHGQTDADQGYEAQGVQTEPRKVHLAPGVADGEGEPGDRDQQHGRVAELCGQYLYVGVDEYGLDEDASGPEDHHHDKSQQGLHPGNPFFRADAHVCAQSDQCREQRGY